jgi:hypothetical protein
VVLWLGVNIVLPGQGYLAKACISHTQHRRVKKLSACIPAALITSEANRKIRPGVKVS